MRSLRRHEFASVGLDDFLATLGDGHNTGLRIPAAVTDPRGGLIVDPYLFLVASVDLIPGDSVIGVDQYLSLAVPQSTSEGGGPPLYPFEVPIRTELWHPSDGFAEWIVTVDNSPPSNVRRGPFDQDSFIREDCETPALVYETAHFPAVPTAPGYLGLDAYTAPSVLGSAVLQMRDLRYPWTHQVAKHALRIPVDTDTRVRFYCRIQQTASSNRITLPTAATVFAAFPGAFAPEDALLSASQTAMAADTLQYWRVAGRIFVDRSSGHRRHFEPGENRAAPSCDNPGCRCGR